MHHLHGPTVTITRATVGNVKKAMEIRREILCDIDAAQNALDFLRDSLPEDAQ